MHFRLLKMIATGTFLTALECTRFFFGQGCTVHPAAGAYSAPPDVGDLRVGIVSKENGR